MKVRCCAPVKVSSILSSTTTEWLAHALEAGFSSDDIGKRPSDELPQSLPPSSPLVPVSSGLAPLVENVPEIRFRSPLPGQAG